MTEVVESGTASGALVGDVVVGGKTGTAETSKGDDDGWFCCYAESSDRTLVFSVLIEGEASPVAVAVAADTIKATMA